MGKYQFGKDATMGETYTDALGSITTPEDAQEYLEALIECAIHHWGQSREEAEKIQRSNIGYMSGYFSTKEMARIQSLFGVVHPIFGGMAEFEKLTTEDIIQKGIDLGSK